MFNVKFSMPMLHSLYAINFFIQIASKYTVRSDHSLLHSLMLCSIKNNKQGTNRSLLLLRSTGTFLISYLLRTSACTDLAGTFN